MAIDAIARKSDHWFKLVDVNGDGRIQHSDLQALADRTLKHFGYEKGSAKGRRLTEAYDRAWVAMAEAMDADRNEEISKEEFRSYMENNAKKENAEKLLRPVTDAEFAAADIDDDGFLSPSEYAKLLQSWGLSSSEAEKGAGNIDTNRDGQISSEEYFRACRDFFVGELTSRTGQVFGQVK
ncbi:EF-hand domain-containing protein [Streptosporangium amethystogenes]|uniref:EF-hand domain-containing protein n=1 Tax=Streptosporangium amethystogenes TaxID=2002 RepID=UPI0004C6820C|nr:EF-hand domain-containing protein [Streptosporangium amethystogenes]